MSSPNGSIIHEAALVTSAPIKTKTLSLLSCGLGDPKPVTPPGTKL